MNIVRFALHRPYTIIVIIIAVLLGSFLAIGKPLSIQYGFAYPNGLPKGMEVDIFPALNLPVIYVCQPYGGMDPAQMEGFITNYYEYHFLYISGIHHVESRNVQGTALMKLFFHEGTNMSQAMAETINYVNRSQAFMPPGTVSPFVMRFDTGSVPVGYLVLSSETRSIKEILDLALFRIRPMFSSLPGVSAPPPFGGGARSIVISADPQKLQSYNMSPDEIVQAVSSGNKLSPSGNMPIGDEYPIVPVNSVVKDPQELGSIPIRKGSNPVYIRDVGTIADSADAPVGYALVNGKRAVYILANKRSDASTFTVINNIKSALPKFKDALGKEGEGIDVAYEFDQSPYVTRSVSSVVLEGVVGAVLIGFMILIFLGDWKSSLIVVLNIPLAIVGAVFLLWVSGQTINIMTLGGLALAIGILVDEATVEIENIHTNLSKGLSPSQAVLQGASETNIPRLLAMLSMLAVFVSSFFMQGAARGLFVPLSLAVGFAMISSYLLSSTFVPVMSVWMLRTANQETHRQSSFFKSLQDLFVSITYPLVKMRWAIIVIYILGTIVSINMLNGQLGKSIFPVVDAGQFRLRMRAPDGTHINKAEKHAQESLELIKQELGAENVALTLGYVGTIPSNFPVNAVYQWSRGPEEAILYVQLKPGFHISDEELKERLRKKLTEAKKEIRYSFEPSDIVNEVMSFGSPTPVDISVSGSSFPDNRAVAEKIEAELRKIPFLRDIQYGQSLDYPTIQVNVDREKAGLVNITPEDVSKALVPATSSSRFTMPNYWADPKSGISYQVQVEMPRAVVRSSDTMQLLNSAADLEKIPLKQSEQGQLLIRDVAEIKPGTMPGQYDRYNMKRQITITANTYGVDLGTVSKEVQEAIKRIGEVPKGVAIDVRGQIPPLQEMQDSLSAGLFFSIVAVFLLLMANFQSVKLALTALSSVPAVICGALLMLWFTHSTINIQSFIGTIMAIGVAMANSILLVTYAEKVRMQGMDASDAGVTGASYRLRAILMTTLAMIAGMLPLALGMGEAGQQNAPLGRAVIGGLLASMIATLFILPCWYSFFMYGARVHTGSLLPVDEVNHPQPSA